MSVVESNEQLMFVALRTFQDPSFIAERDLVCGIDRPKIWDARAATFEAMFQLGMYNNTMGFAQTPEEAHTMKFVSEKIIELSK